MKHPPIKLVIRLTLWLGSLALIAICTLFPFAFDFNLFNGTESIGIAIKNATNPLDILANIVLFLPLGFSSYALILKHSKQNALLSLISISLISFSASLLVEILQLFIRGRYPTLSDIVFNGIGGCLGGFYALQLSLDHKNISSIKLKKKICIAAYLAYFISIYMGLYLFASQLKTSNWQTTYPLTIGNDATGQYPWRGEVSNVFMFDSALGTDSIKKLLDSELDSNSYKSLVFHCLPDNEVYKKNSHLFPKLTLCDQTPNIKKINKDKGNDDWYLTDNTKNDLLKNIASKSTFTIALKINPQINDYFGVVLSIAKDLDHANFVLGMQQNHLTCRIRTPLSGVLGMTPEFILNDYNQNLVDQTIIIVYDGFSFHVFKNTMSQQKQVSLLAGLYFFQPLSRIYQEWRLEILDFHLYKWVFIAFTFAPAVFLFEQLKTTGKIYSFREGALYAIGTSVSALTLSKVYVGSLGIWWSEFVEVLGVILLCWLGIKLYFITLKKYRL